MKNRPNKSLAEKIVTLWDGRDFLGRLQTIMDNRELFWELGLITVSELEMITSMSESAKEYVIQREDQPFFTSINLKEDLDVQIHRNKLEAALHAVFL